MSLLARLETKLQQCRSATWEHTQPIDIRLDPKPEPMGDAPIVAGVVFLVQSRSGAWIEVHREPASVLSDESAVDDMLASGLSIFLMKHPAWPK